MSLFVNGFILNIDYAFGLVWLFFVFILAVVSADISLIFK